jgi:hypothetical protein
MSMNRAYRNPKEMLAAIPIFPLAGFAKPGPTYAAVPRLSPFSVAAGWRRRTLRHRIHPAIKGKRKGGDVGTGWNAHAAKFRKAQTRWLEPDPVEIEERNGQGGKPAFCASAGPLWVR